MRRQGMCSRGIHKIQYWWYMDLRAGGNSGYLANLNQGLIESKCSMAAGPAIELDCLTAADGHARPMEVTADTLRNHIAWFKNIDGIQLSSSQLDRTLTGGPRSIHLHAITDCLMTIQSLQRHDLNIPCFLTSHSPEAFSKEFSDLWRSTDCDRDQVAELQAAVQNVELRAFELSNVWIFPCAESLEGYEDTLPGFRSLSRDKDIRFVRSGVIRPPLKASGTDVREKLGLASSKVLLYIGRHNMAKGYDIFCEAALQILELDKDVSVLVAGREGPLPTVRHPRWIELGWHSDPGSLLRAADVFVLPNDTTYYDLVLLEAMSFGIPTVASATGGNRELSRIANGAVELFERGNVSHCVSLIRNILNDDHRRSYMSYYGVKTYQKFFTPFTFALNYRKLIDSIWRDYRLQEYK